MLRIRENGTQGYRAGTLIDRDVRELQSAFQWVGLPILHQQLNGTGGLAFLQTRLFQTHKLITGLGDIDINRIKLLDRCQGCGLSVGDESPFGYAGFTDAAIDRRRNFGVRKVNTRAFNTGFGSNDAGVCLLSRCYSLVILLLADILCAHQWEITFHGQVRNIGCRLGLRQLASRAVIGCLIGRGINLIK